MPRIEFFQVYISILNLFVKKNFKNTSNSKLKVKIGQTAKKTLHDTWYPCAVKAQKLAAVSLFKDESVLKQNKKKQISVQISEIQLFFAIFKLSILNKHTVVNFQLL